MSYAEDAYEVVKNTLWEELERSSSRTEDVQIAFRMGYDMGYADCEDDA